VLSEHNRTDIHRIHSKTTAVAEWSEVSFSIPQGPLPWQPISWGEIDLQSTHLARVRVPSQDLGVRREVQLLHPVGVKANKLPDSTDTGEPIN